MQAQSSTTLLKPSFLIHITILSVWIGETVMKDRYEKINILLCKAKKNENSLKRLLNWKKSEPIYLKMIYLKKIHPMTSTQ